MSELSINLNKVINAPQQAVFNAWLNAQTLSQFMTPMPGMPKPRTECDGRQGGTFAIYMPVDGEEIPHRGEYLEVKEYDKIVFTWVSPFSPEGSTVTVLLKAVNDETTEIDFTHVKFLDEESRNNHEGGWNVILDTLENLLTSETATAAAAN